jgi:TRAP-type C4-dicarboxylate transport system permease small subunit
LILGLAAAAALVWRGWELWSISYLPLPQNSPGLILAIVGVGLFLYGAGTGLGTRRTF